MTFIRIEYSRVGAETHITPREIIRDFIELLDILYQHPETRTDELMGSSAFIYAAPPLEEQRAAVTGDYAEFEL